MATTTDAPAQPGQRRHHSPESEVSILTDAPCSYTVLQQRPNHRHREKKKSLRRTVKNLVHNQAGSSKQAHPTRGVYVTKRTTPPQPCIMRMKDSDDYLTARFPNPRTGTVSPSIPSASPSPENAVAQSTAPLAACEPNSPCASIASTRANQSRKVSSGHKWKAGARGWVSENVAGLAVSPRGAEVEAGAEMVTSGGGKGRGRCGDKFVMHMPLAREPQPYLHPGCSGEEIERLEKEKRHGNAGKSALEDRRAASGPAGKVTHLREAQAAPGGIREELMVATAASNFAPFSSPRTPAPRGPVKEPTSLKTVKQSAPYRDISPHAAFQAIPRRRVGSSLLIDLRTPDPPPRTSERPGSSPDLRALPRVRLLRPELAAVPLKLRHVSARPAWRECSLGCVKDVGSGQCRLRSCSAVMADKRPLFEASPAKVPAEAKVAKEVEETLDTSHNTVELLCLGLEQLLWFWKRFRMPGAATLAPLVTPEATAQQKLEATKAVLWMSGQASVALLVLLGLWRVIAAVVQIVSVLFWPFMVTLAIARWLVVGR